MWKVFLAALAITGYESFAQDSQFIPGTCYYLDGKKAEGLLDVSNMLKYVMFKPSEDAEPQKIKTSKMLSMIIDSDSFAVIRDFSVESELSDKLVVMPVGIGKVLEEGKVFLYQIYYAVDAPSGLLNAPLGSNSNIFYRTYKKLTRSVYGVRPLGTGRVVTVEVDVDDFITQMTSYFGASKEICDKIRNKEYSYPKTRSSSVMSMNGTETVTLIADTTPQ